MQISADPPDPERLVSASWECCCCGEKNVKHRTLGEELAVQCSSCEYTLGSVDTGEPGWRAQADALIEKHKRRQGLAVGEIVSAMRRRERTAHNVFFGSFFGVLGVAAVGTVIDFSYTYEATVGVLGLFLLSMGLLLTCSWRATRSLDSDFDTVTAVCREAGDCIPKS